MQSILKTITETRKSRFFKALNLQKAILFALCLTMGSTALNAQTTEYIRPSWWFGVGAGANFNFYRGSTQKLNSSLTVPAVFHEGTGIGLFLAPLVEFHKPNTRLGFMFQLGYDGRNGKFAEILTPCNCPADLSVKLNYYTIEPSLRFAPFKGNFYLYGGPRFAFNTDHSFTYLQKPNPAYPNQVASPEVKGDISDVNKTLISMQIGAGYDIQLSSQKKRTQFVLSPFIAFQPYYGQDPRSVETWNITTLRAGAAFKFGFGHLAATAVKKTAKTPDEVVPVTPVTPAVTPVRFMVSAPVNLSPLRTVREIFPLRNYVFFDLGSNEIPKRYVLLKKDEVSNFKLNQVVLSTPENLSGRSDRQMIVYYNILNILGDRMNKNPGTSITLNGSSEKGPADGLIMAENIKSYLVNVYGINPDRIKTEGGFKPLKPSEQPGAVNDLEMLKAGDRRVSIESSSPVLLSEYESGPLSGDIKPLTGADKASDVRFNNQGSSKNFSSWSLQIKDKKGAVQYYGPFTEETTSIPSQTILGSNPEGTYLMTMTGTKSDGSTVTKDTSVHLVHYAYSQNVIVQRFSVIYGYDVSETNAMYKKYLTEVVVPQIPIGATIAIHGFTDVIGDSEYNRKLSLERAMDVRRVMEAALAKAGRSDVKFEIFGFGEDEDFNRYNNKYPEERFYNRGVTVDILEKI